MTRGQDFLFINILSQISCTHYISEENSEFPKKSLFLVYSVKKLWHNLLV